MESISINYEQKGSQERLQQAIFTGDLLEVQATIDRGADVNIKLDGRLPACIAISNGEEDIALFLLSHGTDLTLPPLLFPTPGLDDAPVAATSESIFAKCKGPLTVGIVGLTMLCMSLALERTTLLPEPLTRHLNSILDPLSPLGVHVNNVIANAMPWISFGDQTSQFSRRQLVYLLGIYGLSQFLTGKPQDALRSILSWNWKGKIGRDFTYGVLEISVVYCVRIFGSRQPLEEAQPAFGGVEVVKAILGSAFKSERLVLSLLDQMVFPPDYVRRSLISEESLLGKLWLTAVEEGYGAVTHRLITLGVPIDFDVAPICSFYRRDHGHFGLTALAVAASKGHLELARTLMEYGADVNVQTGYEAATPLILALHFGKTSSSKSEELQGDVQLRLVELLLDQNADINAVDDNDRNSLSHAAENSNTEVFKLLLQRGADSSTVDKKGRTAVHFVSERRDAATFLAILDKVDLDLHQVDDDGYTPFLRAVQNDQVDLVAHFLQRGADPLVRTASDLTALQLAATCGPPRMLELLVSTGIDVNYTGESKESALARACSRHVGRALPLSILLEAGVDPNASSLAGWPRGTPLHRVCQQISYCWSDPTDYEDYLDSIKVLISHGADVNRIYADAQIALERDVSPLSLVASHAPHSIKLRALKELLKAGARPDSKRPSSV